jgi:hypothetical protein
LKIEPITDGGRSINENVYTGWNGTMNFTRVNGSLTALFSALEQNYYAGIRVHWDIAITVQNIDGTLDEYLHHMCSIGRPGFGAFRSRQPVEQALAWEARTMIVTAGPAPLIPSLG